MNPTFNPARFGKQAFSRGLRKWASPALTLAATAGWLLLTSHTARAQTAWKLVSSEALAPPVEGVTHTCQVLQAAEGAQTLLGPRKETLHFVRFDSRKHTFRVLDQTSLGRESLAEVMQKNHCAAGTNGGFFAPDFEPVGLLLSDGNLVRPPQKSMRLLSGALVVTPTYIAICRATEPLPGKNVRQAIQAGPFLVEDGKTVPGLNNARNARRTAVITDGVNEWGLVSCSSVTLEELSVILATPSLMPGGMKIQRALNLDGGSSTALWVRRSGLDSPFYINELGIVRDFVGIVPR